MEPTALSSAMPGRPLPGAGTARLEQATLRSQEQLDVSYTDPNGQAFNLSIERRVDVSATVYDATGSVGRKTGNAHGGGRPDDLRHADLVKALEDSSVAVDGFRQLLHRMLKAVDREYGSRFSAFDLPEAAAVGTHAEVLTVSETVTLRMDTVDTEYWSAENTAGRLKEFAVSLFQGGDRQAHLDKMLGAMEQGYRQAGEAFGGALPDIARQTLDLAREQLTQWAAAGQGQDAAPAQEVPLSLVA